MVGLPGKKSDRSDPPAAITSRLLPVMLDEKRLASLGTLNILDFGRANSGSLEFFNQFSCRLCVLDAADSLLEWSAGLEARMEDPPSNQQMQLELSGLLSSMGAHRYDLVFFWDTLNHLHEHALSAFSGLLRRYLTADCRGHGFMLHKRGTEQMLRHMGMAGDNLIAVQSQSAATLYPHNRKVVNDALGSELRIDQGVLHGDGRLEYLLVSNTPKR
ncbi:hypothetical protein [Congregibacter litoralis]|uniref:Methyltransferase domain protein n=1 Tax=Congregibacter litoralis KT71 TaxID=314285 RepID=A4ABG9_9GAMM|nr:hypothetical protein [Congregibacter litoralis]EAQ96723.1 hypothetical protein KT71_06859 [Congregibacter litoralis KT71]